MFYSMPHLDPVKPAPYILSHQYRSPALKRHCPDVLPITCFSASRAQCLQHLSISEETSLGRADYPGALYSIHSLTALLPALVNLTTLSIDFNFSPGNPAMTWRICFTPQFALQTSQRSTLPVSATFFILGRYCPCSRVRLLGSCTSATGRSPMVWLKDRSLRASSCRRLHIFRSLSTMRRLMHGISKLISSNFPRLETFRVAVEHWDELVAYCGAIDRGFPRIDTFQCHWEGRLFLRELIPRQLHPAVLSLQSTSS